MHRIDTSTATPDNRFTEGDPAIPVPATVVSADWLNAVQEELVAVVTGAGLELDKAENDQLWQAIGQAITAAKPGLATTTAPGLVQIGGGLSISTQGLLSVLTATAAQAGIVRPDGTTCTVEGGVLTVSDKAPAIYNTRLVLTQSNAAWTPPVTGWARVTVIGGGGGGGGGGSQGTGKSGGGGGAGGQSSIGDVIATGGSGGGGGSTTSRVTGGSGGGGASGGVTVDFIYLSSDSPLSVIVGAGGTGGTVNAISGATGGDGEGDRGGKGGDRGSTGGQGGGAPQGGMNGENGSQGDASVGAQHGGQGGANGTGYGGGGGGGASDTQSGLMGYGGWGGDNARDGDDSQSGVEIGGNGGNGGAGAIIVEYYDSAKEVA